MQIEIKDTWETNWVGLRTGKHSLSKGAAPKCRTLRNSILEGEEIKVIFMRT